jgi:LmbE family N-acetylglucosaminyl deacetylase
MQTLALLNGSHPLRILALGAHADDIELGCGGTILRVTCERPDIEILWVVLTSDRERRAEGRASAAAFLAGAKRSTVVIREHRDGFLPYDGADVKNEFEKLKTEFSPDIVFTHYRDDRHQDHRLVSELTWNTWRNHLILEYEVPKYDGDFGSPNFFATLSRELLDRKVELLLRHFPSQKQKPWFTADLFRSVARIRGMECTAPSGFAEAFYVRKARF